MTICDECGKVLTTKKGRRIHSASFDSTLKHKHKSDFKAGIIYAHCDGCYEKLTQPEDRVAYTFIKQLLRNKL